MFKFVYFLIFIKHYGFSSIIIIVFLNLLVIIIIIITIFNFILPFKSNLWLFFNIDNNFFQIYEFFY
jgi:hypothetical protein